jgi:hypothetical protein
LRAFPTNLTKKATSFGVISVESRSSPDFSVGGSVAIH